MFFLTPRSSVQKRCGLTLRQFETGKTVVLFRPTVPTTIQNSSESHDGCSLPTKIRETPMPLFIKQKVEHVFLVADQGID